MKLKRLCVWTWSPYNPNTATHYTGVDNLFLFQSLRFIPVYTLSCYIELLFVWSTSLLNVATWQKRIWSNSKQCKILIFWGRAIVSLVLEFFLEVCTMTSSNLNAYFGLYLSKYIYLEIFWRNKRSDRQTVDLLFAV